MLEHAGGLEVAPKEWAERVVAFLTAVLLVPAK